MLVMTALDVYMRQQWTPNEYTFAVQGNCALIVVHSSLVDLLTADELQAVLAHELARLMSEHSVGVTMANVLLLVSTATLGPRVSGALYNIVNVQLPSWQRAAERKCNRSMLLVKLDLRVTMSALKKLSGSAQRCSHEMDEDEFLAQADTFNELWQTWFGRRLRQSTTASLTHLMPVTRVSELKRWVDSPHLTALLRTGTPLAD